MSELIQFDGRTVAVIAPEDLEQLEADAERYQKVRSSAYIRWTIFRVETAEEFDAAIDAARKP